MNSKILRQHIEWAEGRRPFPYEDSVGKLTIGVGRNLDSNGLRDDEIDLMLSNDVNAALKQAETLSYWSGLNEARQMVIADMVFNMGLRRFEGFILTNRALTLRDYERAADEMVDSKWYRQTKRRAVRLVKVMRAGVWQT